MKKAILFISIISIAFANAQSSWKKIDSKSYTIKSKISERKNQPKKYGLYSLNIKQFKSELSSQKVITIPNNKGGISSFYAEETSNFTNTIAKEYGYIKSFNLKGIDDETARGKISIGKDGVYVTIYSAKHSTLYIDPYTKDKSTFIAYERKNLAPKSKGFGCLVKDNVFGKKIINGFQRRNANDGKLRTYRLALACTGEYAQFHITQQGINPNASDNVKKAAVLSAMNTTITRVNGVFERELAVKMNIVVNSNGVNQLIYLNSDSDPFTNDDSNVLINESQSTCDNVVGTANYDIGHTFSTGAGGLAGVGVVCSNSQKAQGVTGTNRPINDAYDIDFVAHEIGHQFGAPHTFNGDSGDCGGNRSDRNAVEPGSGSTIMGYAGLCTPQNVSNRSDDYFHSVSIASMWSVIKSKTCPTLTNTNNVAPTANAGIDVHVPKSTPLVLRGQATDTDSANSLTYCWEQLDTEIVTQPPVSTNTGGPAFRSLPPTQNSERYLPALPTVIKGKTSSTWEVLPSVARDMNFSLTVRDNHPGGGASARDDVKITVTNAEPFTVTSQDSDVIWNTGSKQTITWNKSTTNQAPINCTNVKIKLSTDGGVTFPITLVESTPNDGSHELIVANHPTTMARIMVEAVDNIFYNVNTANFTIKHSTTPTFLLSKNINSQSICNSTSNVVSYTFDIERLNNFNETISFSASNLPNGSTATFSPITTNTNSKITLTISNLNNVAVGEYNFTINAISNSVNKSLNFVLAVNNQHCTSRGHTNSRISTTLVNFGEINNRSSKTTGYSNFKSISTGVVKGESYSLSVNANSDGNNTVNSYAWIDWNQNCVFDNDELFNLGTVTNGNTPTSGSGLSITVPNNASLGKTILRVITEHSLNSTPNSCKLNFNGETEDYTVIVEESFATNATLFSDLSIYPVPSNGKINVNFKVKDKNSIILKLYDLRGRLINTKKFSTISSSFAKEINLGSLSSEVYILQIENGGKITSKKIIIK